MTGRRFTKDQIDAGVCAFRAWGEYAESVQYSLDRRKRERAGERALVKAIVDAVLNHHVSGGGGQAGAEITPAMIDAGVNALLEFDSEDLRFSYREAVKEIYAAMASAAPGKFVILAMANLPKKSQSDKPRVSEDDVLKRMLNTPPKPHVPSGTKNRKARARPVSDDPSEPLTPYVPHSPLFS